MSLTLIFNFPQIVRQTYQYSVKYNGISICCKGGGSILFSVAKACQTFHFCSLFEMQFSENESEKFSQAFQSCNGKFVRSLSNNSLQAHKINFSFLSKINEPGKSHPF